MRIGELARRAGTSTRMIRYYEAQGLITAQRATNGYRSYDERDVDRARTIVSLIQSGLPSKLVRVVLTAQDQPAEWCDTCDLEFAKFLRTELETINEKISCLSRSRAAVEHYLERSAGSKALASNT